MVSESAQAGGSTMSASITARVIFGGVTVVGLVSTVLLLHETLWSPKPAWQQRTPQSDRSLWREPWVWAGLATFAVVTFILVEGFESLLRGILGFRPGYYSEGEWVSWGGMLGVLAAIALLGVYDKLRKLSTEWAGLRFEFAVREHLKPFRDLWGAEWTYLFDRLKEELQKVEGDRYSDPRKREALQEAVARAEGEAAARLNAGCIQAHLRRVRDAAGSLEMRG